MNKQQIWLHNLRTIKALVKWTSQRCNVFKIFLCLSGGERACQSIPWNGRETDDHSIPQTCKLLL